VPPRSFDPGFYTASSKLYTQTNDPMPVNCCYQGDYTHLTRSNSSYGITTNGLLLVSVPLGVVTVT